MASWSEYQTESEEEALAKAMELSLMEDKKSSRKAEFPIHIGEETSDGRLSSREAPSPSSSTYHRQGLYSRGESLVSGVDPHSGLGQKMAEFQKESGELRTGRAPLSPRHSSSLSQSRGRKTQQMQRDPTSIQRAVSQRTGDKTARAIPLCLPNNYQWDSKARQCVKTNEIRSSLCVVEEALEELRTVKGPVCTVAVAGPLRKGKSYILSEAFDQPGVFPLGHEFDPETMGIWMWIVPEKYKDLNGQEVTVVLLDSEGVDAAFSEGRDDNQIFTLTVLLASVLIYNSSGVPTRSDLDSLHFISKLSERIHARSNWKETDKKKEEEFLHRTFPFFIWLLRDVALSIPRDCRDIKDYFLKKVFRQDASRSRSENGDYVPDVAEDILRFFPGFEAFALSPPSTDLNVLKNLNTKKDQLQPQFLSELEQIKKRIKSMLVPKHSCTEGELITGEGLAALITPYVYAINTPGVVPNVQDEWDLLVQNKCSDTRKKCQQKYNELMALKALQLPCDNAEIRWCHNSAMEKAEELFKAEMSGISITTVEKHLRQLKSFFEKRLNELKTKNSRLTRQFCDDLLLQLKTKHLDPVIEQLQGREDSKLSFDDILSVYRHIKDDYEAESRGAKDAIAEAFSDFHRILAEDAKHNRDKLKQLKDFDQRAAKEIVAEAFIERKRRQVEEDKAGLLQENRTMEKETQMLIDRSEKERAGMQVQKEEMMKKEREQLQNMKQAGLVDAQEQREAYVKENQAIGEEHMEMMKSILEMIAANQRENKQLLEQMKTLSPEEFKESVKELERRQSESVNALLMKMEARVGGIKSSGGEDFNTTTKDEECAKKEEDLLGMMTSRAQTAGDLHQRLVENERDQSDLRTGEMLKKVLKFIEDVAPVVGKVAALHPTCSPYAMPVASAVKSIAQAMQSLDCSIM
nr:guanylate-binding protein 6-like [Pocillopora verrucosa]